MVADLIEGGLNEDAGRFARELWALCEVRARFYRLGLPRKVNIMGLASGRHRNRPCMRWKRAS